jgi:hypothetical protein
MLNKIALANVPGQPIYRQVHLAQPHGLGHPLLAAYILVSNAGYSFVSL